jgi:UPF0716 protein FxsA
MPIFFIVFVLVPVSELWLLFRVSDWIGAMATLLLVIVTAALGVSLLKRQGLRTLLEVSRKMQEGQLPIEELAHGVMLAVAGALLLTPGLITDTCGFALLHPATRRWLARRIMSRMQGQIQMSAVYARHEYRRDAEPPADQPDIIEGEYHRDDPDSRLEDRNRQS